MSKDTKVKRFFIEFSIKRGIETENRFAPIDFRFKLESFRGYVRP